MSVFKPFITSDVIVSPFEVNKSFAFSTDNFTDSDVGIERYYGVNITSSLWVSGSNPTGQNTTQDTILVYRSIKELYYSNYINGIDGSPAGTASFNPDGTITGPAYTPNYYNYLYDTLPANRFIPTGSGEQIGVISIPSNLFGEYLKPGTVILVSPYGPILVDDGNGSLTSGSIDLNGNYISSDVKYGDIIYEHGMVIITTQFLNSSPNAYGSAIYGSSLYGGGGATTDLLDLFINTDNSYSMSFDSTLTIFETQYKCTIRENEFNFSTNPTQISGSLNNGVLYNFATGSYFSPYVTTVGLYDNNYNLLAVAKLAQPLPTSAVTDTSILINLDL
jgi:hypothetical protein